MPDTITELDDAVLPRAQKPLSGKDILDVLHRIFKPVINHCIVTAVQMLHFLCGRAHAPVNYLFAIRAAPAQALLQLGRAGWTNEN